MQSLWPLQGRGGGARARSSSFPYLKCETCREPKLPPGRKWQSLQARGTVKVFRSILFSKSATSSHISWSRSSLSWKPTWMFLLFLLRTACYQIGGAVRKAIEVYEDSSPAPHLQMTHSASSKMIETKKMGATGVSTKTRGTISFL